MNLARRRLIIAAALFGGALLTEAMRPTRLPVSDAARRLSGAFPDRVGVWTSAHFSDFILPTSDPLSQAIYQAQALQGYKSNTGQHLYCLVAYGSTQDYALQLHRPEICYQASGFALRNFTQHELTFAGRRVNATMMTAERRGRIERVLFWTRVGQAFPATQWQVRQQIARSWLMRQLPDGLLFRVSLTLGNDETTDERLLAFVNQLVAAMPLDVQNLILGPRM